MMLFENMSTPVFIEVIKKPLRFVSKMNLTKIFKNL